MIQLVLFASVCNDTPQVVDLAGDEVTILTKASSSPTTNMFEPLETWISPEKESDTTLRLSISITGETPVLMELSFELKGPVNQLVTYTIGETDTIKSVSGTSASL